MVPAERYRPKKRLGQVFLADQNLLAKTAHLVDASDRVVVEIGAGDGRLTELLAKVATNVYAVEYDAELFEVLERRFGETPNVTPVQADARALNLAELLAPQHRTGDIRVAGNLPYCSFVPILLRLVRQMDQIADFRIMGQLEMAQRLEASPNTREYGRLSVTVQARCDVKRLLFLPATAFWPRPKVDSALIRLVPSQSISGDSERVEAFDRFVTAAFSHRRKTLVNSLTTAWSDRRHSGQIEEALLELGLPRNSRPQSIPVDKYIELFNVLLKYMREVMD